MLVTIRKFEKADIQNKVKWINDEQNNRYLRYDLPLTYEGTCQWYKRVKDLKTRYDAVIEAEGIPVGIIGLLNIDYRNKRAEYYVTLGNSAYKGKGVAKKATQLLLYYAFEDLQLNKIYLYVQTDNLPAVNLYKKIGFIREGTLHEDVINRGKFVSRHVYGFYKKNFNGALNKQTKAYINDNHKNYII